MSRYNKAYDDLRNARDQNQRDGRDNDRTGWQPPQGKQNGQGAQEQERTPRKFISFADIQLDTMPSYLVKDVLPRTGIVVAWGEPKCGKSFWAFDLVMHIAIGREYRGRRVRQGNVIYLALEGGAGFRRRIVAWRRECLGDYDGIVPFFFSDKSLNLVGECSELIADIRGQLTEPPAVIVIDTLNRSLMGSESTDEDMGAYIRAADALRATFDCLVLIVHHCGIAKNRPRGHTSLTGAVDGLIAVKRVNGTILAEVECAKDFDSGAKFASELKRIELGFDSDSEIISSCILTEVEAPDDEAEAKKPKGAKETKLSPTSEFALKILNQIITGRGEDPPADLNLPNGYRVVKNEDWRKAFYAAHPIENQEAKKKAFQRASTSLFNLGETETFGEFTGLKLPKENPMPSSNP